MGRSCLKLFFACAAIVAATGAFWVPVAGATVGAVVADVSAPGAGVAFDGHNLYYTDTAGLFLHALTPAGTPAAPDVAVVGAAGIQALAYDATRERLWAVDGSGLAIYAIEKSGLAMPVFVVNPATDLPGLCGSLTGCSTKIDGVAYDGTDDSIWYLPDGSTRLYHMDTAGIPLGYLDISSLGCSTATGVAAADGSLYVTACGRVIRATKTDTGTASVLSSFAAPGAQAGDVECDDLSFSPDVAWIRNGDGHLRAVEIAAGSCFHGGGLRLDPTKGWMTGGGSFEALQPQSIDNPTVTAHEGLHLQCDGSPPNNLQVTWGNGNGFHLDSKATLGNICHGTPTKSPTSSFNALQGSGFGRLRLGNGKTITGWAQWDFRDNNEPGGVQAAGPNGDDESLFIYQNGRPDQGGIEVLEACTCPIQGNLQAHEGK